MAQLVEHVTLDSGSGHEGHGIEPHIGLYAGYGACLIFSLSLSLSLSVSLSFSLSVSLSFSLSALPLLAVLSLSQK